MAKKHHNPLIEDPPTASSSSDDEVESSGDEGEEDSSSDEEPTQNPVKIPVAVAIKATPSKSAAVSVATKATPAKSTTVSAATKATPAKSTAVSADTKATPGKSTTVSAATKTAPGKSTTVSAATKAAPGKPTVVSVAKEDSDSDSEGETETDSGSDSEDTVPPVLVLEPNKKDPSSSAVALALPAEKSGKKRSVTEETPSKETKRAKIVASGEEESAKKPAFQRLWNEEGEITILQGMIDYKGDTGKSPYEDTNAFYEFVKNSLSIEASKNQLMDKVRSLKKKFMGKEDKKKGPEPKFARDHDKKTYQLSKHIWGSEGLAFESNIKANGVVSKKSQSEKKEKVETVKALLSVEDDGNALIHGESSTKSDWFEKSFLVRSIAGLGVDESTVKEKWNLVAAEDKKKIEAKLKKLQDQELEFVLQKTEFVHEVVDTIVEASNNKN